MLLYLEIFIQDFLILFLPMQDIIFEDFDENIKESDVIEDFLRRNQFIRIENLFFHTSSITNSIKLFIK